MLGVMDYPINQSGVDSQIDVVWVIPMNQPVVAFELNSSKKNEDILKLSKINVRAKYWLYYGSYGDINSFVSHFDINHLINVIDLPYYKNKFRDHIPKQ